MSSRQLQPLPRNSGHYSQDDHDNPTHSHYSDRNTADYDSDYNSAHHTHTTTQQMTTATTESTTTMAAVGSSPDMGWAFALIGIGIGVACAGGGVAAALTGRQYPQVFTYDGYYYCMKHRVPVW